MRNPENVCTKHPDVVATAALASEEPSPESLDCVACVASWEQVRSLRALGQQLTWDDPDAERVTHMRRSIIGALRADSTGLRGWAPKRATTPRHWGVRAVAAASFAVIVAFLVVRYQHRIRPVEPFEPASLAAIETRGVAHFQQVRRPPDEELHVTEGKLHVAVVHLAYGQRFRIVTADSTVEVRGTEFDVEVATDSLLSVDVSRGKVEVRVAELDPVTLTPGSHWETPRGARSLTPPAPRPAQPIGPAAEFYDSQRPHRRSEPANARNVPASPNVPGMSIGPTPLIDSPSQVKAGRPAASLVAPGPRKGKESPPTPMPPPSVSGAGGATAVPAEQKENQQDERLDRRQERREEHLERRRELREERLQRRR